METGMADPRQEHWDRVFSTKPDNMVSWYQHMPETSLRLIRACRLPLDARIVDIGAGASRLPDALLPEGFSNITVLDISPVALTKIRERLVGKAGSLCFVAVDITKWQSIDGFDLWHDRAVLHFLTEGADRLAYANVLRRVVRPGGFVLIAGFAPTGPERCSGLPVCRADQHWIAGLLGPDFELLDAFETNHQTPSGGLQRFVFARFRRRSFGLTITAKAQPG
jgi:SAM-dependent methyltransferase